MINLGWYYIARYRADYYDGRPRGTVAVYRDASVWLYRQPPRVYRAEFKLAIYDAFCKDGERVIGKFPAYTIAYLKR